VDEKANYLHFDCFLVLFYEVFGTENRKIGFFL